MFCAPGNIDVHSDVHVRKQETIFNEVKLHFDRQLSQLARALFSCTCSPLQDVSSSHCSHLLGIIHTLQLGCFMGTYYTYTLRVHVSAVP